MTLNNLVESVKAHRTSRCFGVFPPDNPTSKDFLEKQGQIVFDIGKFFERGLSMGSGQTNVKAYNRHLAKLIQTGKAKPSFSVSHELPLDDAPEAYTHFDARENGWTKVVLKPGMAETKKGKAASAGQEK